MFLYTDKTMNNSFIYSLKIFYEENENVYFNSHSSIYFLFIYYKDKISKYLKIKFKGKYSKLLASQHIPNLCKITAFI